MREALVKISESSFTDLGIEELHDLLQAAELQDFKELTCHGNNGVIQVRVSNQLDESRLQDLEYVGEWTHVVAFEDYHLYVISFSAPGLSDRVGSQEEDLIRACNSKLSENGATMSLIGTHDAISGTVEEYAAGGADPEIRKIGPYEGGENPLDNLTQRQREVIQTAFEMGYYEVPRDTTTDCVADKLDLDSSTVTEHLQRAERNLLSHHLSSSD